MFVVIEGIDGSGKATQTRLLVDNLKRAGLRADSVSFPAYGEGSCRFVENFLNGAYGPTSGVDPYVASSFYVLDRFEQKPKLLAKLAENDVVVSDRYSTASFLHRGTAFLENGDRAGLDRFFQWLHDFEFVYAGLPKPDLILFLSLSMESVRALIEKKMAEKRDYVQGGGLDLAEKDVAHQAASLRVGHEFLPSFFPKLKIVECEGPDGKLMAPEAIAEKILGLVTAAKR